ncbi:hypothetical protein BV25DRAFT_1915339 [Artomyces pyxidatus]|uniref:Uncharacterized protein n=1 Tax=Artomyces pyxidatus TaxID=48021 RepID=A0ACB8T426_9AGAM|nr:hypothetical protein BV25DRAFT_1915339 [Artomyces pyxidatus]
MQARRRWDVNIGTIFGIYETAKDPKGTIADVLSPGSQMVAADLNVVKRHISSAAVERVEGDVVLVFVQDLDDDCSPRL